MPEPSEIEFGFDREKARLECGLVDLQEARSFNRPVGRIDQDEEIREALQAFVGKHVSFRSAAKSVEGVVESVKPWGITLRVGSDAENAPRAICFVSGAIIEEQATKRAR